ncbi:MAG: bifunctional (p)ppGpp synthetase/guanosine-3',5'-bis(diphosphate) 3'-pyrophosphohydrolase [Alphaproteobacteria bacterium]|nr:bifunctional (p)ppGpp synthetase/guanosine-3',5'-bis(diphosphate) 3'-pyrophosphohydrolase [Alphaproteobacteria bacterium]
MIRQYELVDRILEYNPNADEALINKAYVYAMRAHGSQKRHNGDPYFSHPLQVAGIMTDLRLDDASIATALLHDTVEDTETTHEDISRLFGAEIAHLVDGVTKLSKLELSSPNAAQAENFRKLFVAMSQDVRVLLVKLADRLHNMRTLHFVPHAEKRRRIAQETLDLYAPLAGRIGMQSIREELEEIAFRELNPDMHASITARIDRMTSGDTSMAVPVLNDLRDLLRQNGYMSPIHGRTKRPFSIFVKMQRQGVGLEQLSDVFACRVITSSIAECYQILGLIHTHWAMVPNRFKDYISTPKRNGYRSLHTTIVGPSKQRVEIQIRTAHMHEIAEKGLAAHWAYKEGDEIRSEDTHFTSWINELLQMIEAGDPPEDFLEHSRLEMFHDQVFCFTPRGDVIGLPSGATPLDFAFAVHTEIGYHAVGTKVNGLRQPLGYVLQNADEVEILLSKQQRPQRSWESIAKTGKAKAAIRRYFREQNQAQMISFGRELLESGFRDAGFVMTKKLLDQIAGMIGQKVDPFLYDVGCGQISVPKVIGMIYPDTETHFTTAQIAPIRVDRTGLVPGVSLHLSRCCFPVPGDRIVGVRDSDHGIDVHIIDCAKLVALSPMAEHWVDLRWPTKNVGGDHHLARLEVDLAHEVGALSELTGLLGRVQCNIDDLVFLKRDKSVYRIRLDLEVRDLRHLEQIKNAMSTLENVTLVRRVRGDAQMRLVEEEQ